MVDLHIHSTHSDGVDNVIDILKKAEEKKLKCISITDHNTCSAYEELKYLDVDKYYSGKIIEGIELNTKVLGIPIEILAYKFNTDLMTNYIKGMFLSPEERNILEVHRLFDKCKESQIDLGPNFIEHYSPNQYPSKYLHETLTKNEKNKSIIDEEAWNNSLVLYRKYMSDPDSLLFVDTSDVLPSLDEIIDLIKKTAGLVFIPHIFEYKKNSMKILNYILENYEINGIECYYSTFDNNQTEELLRICKERKILISGGSDYHNIKEFGIDIGIGKGDLKVPYDAVKNWI